jgi:hypothetical protein
MQPAPVPQEPYTGWLGDVIGRVKDFRLPEGPSIPGARTPLNPSGTLGGGVNMLKDMLISTGEDFGAEGGHKDTPIPMGKLAAAGLFPLRGISKVAKSLISGVDEAAEAASRTRRMQDAERSVAAAGRAEREALKEAGHYAELPGEARRARQTAATTEREELLDIMGEAGLEDPNSVDAILREAYGSTPPKSSLDFLEPQWADDLASAEPVAQTSKGTPGLQREDTLIDGRPRIKMSESTGHLVPDRPLLKLDPATRGTSPATPQTQPRQTRTPKVGKPRTELGSHFGKMADDSGYTKIVAGDDPDKVQAFYDILDLKSGQSSVEDFHAIFKDIQDYATGSRPAPVFDWKATDLDLLANNIKASSAVQGNTFEQFTAMNPQVKSAEQLADDLDDLLG